MIKILFYLLRVYSYTESGLFVGILERFRLNALLIFNRENRVYLTVAEFVDDKTKFDNLSFGNFRMVFICFFSFCLVLLLVFVVHLLYRKDFQFTCGLKVRRERRYKRKVERRTVKRRLKFQSQKVRRFIVFFCRKNCSY